MRELSCAGGYNSQSWTVQAEGQEVLLCLPFGAGARALGRRLLLFLVLARNEVRSRTSRSNHVGCFHCWWLLCMLHHGTSTWNHIMCLIHTFVCVLNVTENSWTHFYSNCNMPGRVGRSLCEE